MRGLGVLLCVVFAALTGAGQAQAETRSLKLYYIHTKEKAEIVFKRNGRYDQAGLNKLNRFLRDWRRNEPTKMDPRLFDIVWEVYRQSGAKDYINVVSAYRSPATNDMLRRTRGGQAEKSQHMVGKAMDFYIPGVKLSKLREIAFKIQGGGVGYYPKSGSPFVHLDTGNVRAWPRMSRSELVRLFPDGKTLHLPADGKPLPGYNQALAAYKARQASGNLVASSGSSSRSKPAPESGSQPTLLGMLFGGADEEEDNAESSIPVAAPRPAAPVATAAPQPAEPVAPAVAPEPEVLVAALPTTNAPVPTPAPRLRPAPVVVAEAVPAPIAAPEVAVSEVPLPAGEDPADPAPRVGDDTLVALNVPRPSPRPAFTPQPVSAAPDAELLARLDAIGGGDDARSALREALGVPDSEANVAETPIVTALVPAVRPVVPDLGLAGKAGRLVVPSARPAIEKVSLPVPQVPVKAGNAAIGEAAKTGVKTTAKTSKPKGLQPSNTFDVAPLPASSSRFGPGSAQSALRLPVQTTPVAQLAKSPRTVANGFQGRAVTFETTGATN